jgi:predicted nucleic acid-binding protein
VIVADASVVIDILVPTASTPANLGTRLESELVVAPELLDVEVAQVLRRFVLKDQLDVRRAEAALEDLALLPIERYPHASLIQRAFALRNNVTTYDGVYIALAEQLDATLWTRDAALGAIPGLRLRVDVA